MIFGFDVVVFEFMFLAIGFRVCFVFRDIDGVLIKTISVNTRKVVNYV